MTCPIEVCRLGPDDDFLRPHERTNPQILAACRNAKPGTHLYYHRVEERLTDLDGEIVLVLEGGHILEV